MPGRAPGWRRPTWPPRWRPRPSAGRRGRVPSPGFAQLEVLADGRVVRPPGLRLDSGGLGKGLAADLAAELVPAGVRYAISVGGDMALGGGDWEMAVTGARVGDGGPPAAGTRRRGDLRRPRAPVAARGRQLRPSPARPLDGRARLDRPAGGHRGRGERARGRGARQDRAARGAGRRAPRAAPPRRRAPARGRPRRGDRAGAGRALAAPAARAVAPAAAASAERLTAEIAATATRAVAWGAREQPDLARERTGRGQVDRLADRDAQRRGHARGPPLPVGGRGRTGPPGPRRPGGRAPSLPRRRRGRA